MATTEPKIAVSAEADDLADDLVYDVDFTASDNEVALDSGLEDGGDSKVEATKVQYDTEKEINNNGRKRKANGSKLQEKKRLKMEYDIEQKRKLAQESSTDSIAESINNKLRQKNPDLSALELAELYLSKSDIRSTSDFNEQKRNLDNLPKFISAKFKNMLPNAPKKGKSKQSKNKPSTKVDESIEERKFIAILSMSALRACDVHRSLRDISGSSLKLINKNKLNVDLKLVSTTRSRVLCCTPGRLLKVLESEELELKKEEIKILIIDNSYLDQKCQNVLDIKETNETLKSLTKTGSKIYLY